MKLLRTLLSAAILAIALVAPASAQVINGDFEAGATGWNVNQPPNWTVSFPDAGGNPGGYGRIQSPFGGLGGVGSIFQTIQCGTAGIPGNCLITVNYLLEQIDAADFTGRIKILVDGTVAHTSDPGLVSGWISITITVPCGVHVLSLDLEVDPENNGWAACFDAVDARCEPIVPVAPSTWGRIKSLIVS